MTLHDIEVQQPSDDIALDTSSGEAAIPSTIQHVTAIPENPIKALGWVYKAERLLILVVRWAVVLLSLALGFLMAAQVLMRYGLQSPFLGIEELAPMFGLWIYFLGMAHATRERDHITGGIIGLIFKNQILITSVRITGTLLCLFAICIFSYYAQKYALFNLSIGRASPYMGFSKAIWDFSMVVGFVLTGFYLVLQLISEIQQITAIVKYRRDAI
jgi:TRAP-type C4-dicarboxylate transport system permease small subunit